jgi:hypothetical protein
MQAIVLRRFVVGIVSIGFGFAAGGLLRAQDQEQPVPIEQEPRHLLKFANEYVRVFDVELPPGYVSKYHVHVNDGVFINLAASETEETVLGGEPNKRPPRQHGQTYFTEYSKQQKTHRVSNIGSTHYRVIDVEILKSCPLPITPISTDKESILVDNPRVFVERMILTPGKTKVLGGTCAVWVPVSAGNVVLSAGGAQVEKSVVSGEFAWRFSEQPHTLLNRGAQPFHAVQVLIK